MNNTILVPASGGWCIRITDDLGGNVVFNNILLCDNPSKGSISLDNTTGFASGTNVVTDCLSLDRGNTILSLAAWQAAGYGQGSLAGTAGTLFVAPSSDDYHLAVGSPAVDRGVLTFAGQSAPTADREGNARPLGAGLDVGSHEAR